MPIQNTAPAPLPTAILAVTVKSFRPIGAITALDYQLTLVGGDPAIFQLKEGKLTVKVPSGTEVKIDFHLDDSRYVLLGIALTSQGPGTDRLQFPTVTIDRTVEGSAMSVLDRSLADFNGVVFTYGIFVQDVATGNIGMIDPEFENELP